MRQRTTECFLLGLLALTLAGLSAGCVFPDGSFHDKRVNSVEVDLRDQPRYPTLLTGRISQEKQLIEVFFPNTVKIGTHPVRLQFSGLAVQLDGSPVPTEPLSLDFTRDHRVSVLGKDDGRQEYRLTARYEPKVFSFFHIGSAYFQDHGRWDGTRYGYFEPTKSISLILEPSDTLPLTAYFNHNCLAVLLDGKTEIPSGTTLDATGAHTLELVGADGSTQQVALNLTFRPLTVKSFQILAKDNPGILKADCDGTVDETAKTITVRLPSTAPLGSMSVHIAHNGLKAKIGAAEILPGKPCDLTGSPVLSLEGTPGQAKDYSLKVTTVPPSSDKTLTSWDLYTFSATNTPQVSAYAIPGTKTQLTPYEAQLRTSDYPGLTLRYLYLEIQTAGVKVTLKGGKTLTQGRISTIFSENNWLDFSQPVVLTITAEDGSTSDVTLTVKGYFQ